MPHNTDETMNFTAGALRSPDDFGRVMHRCYGRIYFTALSMVRQPEMADDIAQETFVRAWLKRDSVNDQTSNLQPWLVRIARNLAIDWLRTGQQRSRVLPLISLEDAVVEPEDSATPTPRQAVEAKELHAQLNQAVMLLPEDLRQVVLLHYAENMKPSDIAHMNGEAPSSVTRRLDRARKLLRSHLESPLTTGLASLRPAHSLQKALALITAATALPAATNAAVMGLIADTPVPPLPGSQILEPTGSAYLKAIAGKVGAAKFAGAAAVAVLAVAGIGAGSYLLARADSNRDNPSSGRTDLARISVHSSDDSASAAFASSRNRTPDTAVMSLRERTGNASKPQSSGSLDTDRTGTARHASAASVDPSSAATSASQVTVSGLVYDEGTSEPLAGAVVQVLEDNKVKHETSSTETGRYTIAAPLAEGSWILNARLPGYMPLPTSGYTSKNGEPPLAVRISSEQDAVEKVIPMVPAVEVSGHITDADGNGIAEAPVIWRGTREFTAADHVITTSTADGSFKFTTLPFQEGFVDIAANGFSCFRSHNISLADKNVPGLQFKLEQGATAAGTVKNQAGHPIAGAKLTVSDQYSLGTGVRFDNRKIATTDHSGRFHLGSLIPGKTSVRVYADGYAPAFINPEVQPGQHQEGIDVVLDEGLTIEGQVVGPEGEPTTAHINVGVGASKIIGAMDTRPVQKTNSDGSFILRGFTSGTVTLHVISHNPQRDKTVTVKAGDKNVRVEMGGEVTIHARVIDSMTKKPVGDFKVSNVGEYFRKGEPAGGFRFLLEPGHSTFPEVTADGYVTEKFTVVAPKDKPEAEVTLELGSGAGVTGRVVSATTGKPMADIAVAAFDSTPFNDSPIATTVTDEDGGFVIAHLPGNKLKITAIPDMPYAHTSKEVETLDGKITDAGDIAVSAGGRIFGTVVSSESDAPPQNVQIFFSGPEGKDITWTFKPLAASGTFNYPGLKPGKYKVGANANTHVIELEPGEEREIIITLGHVEMRGAISVNGETTGTAIHARNIATGQISASRQVPGKGYVLSNLSPGPHEITFINSQFDDTPPVHTEVYVVPNQAKVQKDFVVP